MHSKESVRKIKSCFQDSIRGEEHLIKALQQNKFVISDDKT